MSLKEQLQTLRAYQDTLGLRAGTLWSLIRSAGYRGLAPSTITIRPKVLHEPVSVRLGASSDRHVFEQIFVHGEMEFVRSIDFVPKVIIDLGANVGYVSALFLSLFPDAFVLAVEPEPGNAARCRDNLRGYGRRARVIEAGVWPVRSGLVIRRDAGDGKEWAVQVAAARDGETPDVQAMDMPTLLDFCPSRTVDLLKIDIEGSELPLFSEATETWLGLVRNLCVELHGPACREAVEHALRGFDYRSAASGEYTLYLDLKAKSA